VEAAAVSVGYLDNDGGKFNSSNMATTKEL